MGKIRHLEVRHLWLQQVVRDGKVLLRKVAGKLNPADLLTKGLGIVDVEKLLGLMNASVKKMTSTRRNSTASSSAELALVSSRFCSSPFDCEGGRGRGGGVGIFRGPAMDTPMPLTPLEKYLGAPWDSHGRSEEHRVVILIFWDLDLGFGSRIYPQRKLLSLSIILIW